MKGHEYIESQEERDIKKLAESHGVQTTEKISNISEKMKSDAFMCLTIALMNEFFIASDMKFLVFQNMISNLQKLGYNEEQMEEFATAMNEAIKRFQKKNSFMG